MFKLFEKYEGIIKYWKILKFEQFGLNLRLRVEIGFIDDSILHVRETVIEGDKRKYSYHWQSNNGNIITRWDNAPDWDVETFPHHKHSREQIEPSYERTLEQVLKTIAKYFENK